MYSVYTLYVLCIYAIIYILCFEKYTLDATTSGQTKVSLRVNNLICSQFKHCKHVVVVVVSLLGLILYVDTL